MNIGAPAELPWQDCYCSSCRTLLFRTVPSAGLHISMRCRRCNAINVLHIQDAPHRNGDAPDEMKHLLHLIDDKLSVLTKMA